MKKETKRRLYTYTTLALIIILLLTLFFGLIYFRYPEQKFVISTHFSFIICFASICFWAVFAAFAHFIIINGEQRERQGLPFFKERLSFTKITTKFLLVMIAAVAIFWKDIKDFDLILKKQYAVMYNASYVKYGKDYGRYSYTNRWNYTFINNKDTLVLQTSYEYPNISTLPTHTKNLKVTYLPNTKKLIEIE